MIRTLRITSLVSVITACAGVVFVLIFGFKPNSEIKDYLSKASIVEELKKKTGNIVQKEEKESPLVVQAKKFALRIDPPPPPAPVKKIEPPKTPKKEPVILATDTIDKPITKNATFELVATANYPGFPEKSLALLNLVSAGTKWHREGDTIGRLTIHEIKDGSIVLYQNGKKNSELFVPKPKETGKSLLKSDKSGPVSAQGPSSATTVITTEPQSAVAAAAPTEIVEAIESPTGSDINLPGIDSRTSREPTGNVRIRSRVTTSPAQASVAVEPPLVQPEPMPTPKEQMQSIDESISGIKEMMNNPTEGMSEAEIREQQQAWKELLDLLEQEKKTLEANIKENAQDSLEPKETPQDEADKTEEK